MGIHRATKFFPLDTVRDNWLVRQKEFVQDNIADWGDPGLVSWGELSVTKRSLTYESYLNYSICALTRLLRKLIHVIAKRPATLLKKRHLHRCFHVNFANFLRATILHNIYERLLLSKLLVVRNWLATSAA